METGTKNISSEKLDWDKNTGVQYTEHIRLTTGTFSPDAADVQLPLHAIDPHIPNTCRRGLRDLVTMTHVWHDRPLITLFWDRILCLHYDLVGVLLICFRCCPDPINRTRVSSGTF